MHTYFKTNDNLRFFKIGLFCLLLLAFESCTNSETEVAKMEDLVPITHHESDSKHNVVKNIDPLDTLKNPLKSIFKNLLVGKNPVLVDKKSYLDRFGPKKSLSLTFSTDSSLEMLSCWTFSDTLKTENAFYNWLDCFGSNCTAIKVGERVMMRENTGEIWVGDTLLMYWQSENTVLKSSDRSRIEQLFPDTLRFHLCWQKKHALQWMKCPSLK